MRLIEKLLNDCDYGATAEFARYLGKTQGAVNHAIKRGVTPKLQREYTNAFNRCFETNYRQGTLFKEIEESTIDND